MKKLALLLFTFQFCSSLLSFGQNENNIWAFGSGNGIDFNVSPPVVIGTAISSVEGAASVCDASGNLLFYSNGITVWDNTNTPMPNGSGLFGAPLRSATQGVAIAPVADSPNLYLLFSLEEQSTTKTGRFWYSVVDMSLNGGKGDVVSTRKNILVGANMSEKMITAPACNGVWLITHHLDSAIFYAYKVNALGTLDPPVISHTAGHNIPENYYIGEMKLSPDETK
ncbi:MAG: hypothetical protein IT256_04995, partial [Chitinophagaceae bacterium]|nr:hypothetical protein [Chitinophagaceae bacterium]